MTWGEFKQDVERQGVKDETEIRSIDVLDSMPYVLFTAKHAIIEGRCSDVKGRGTKNIF